MADKKDSGETGAEKIEITESEAKVHDLIYVPDYSPHIKKRLRATVYENKDGKVTAIRLEEFTLVKSTWSCVREVNLSTLEVLLLSKIFSSRESGSMTKHLR